MDRRVAKAQASIRQAFRGASTRVNPASPVSLVQADGLMKRADSSRRDVPALWVFQRSAAGTMAIFLPVGGKTSHCILIGSEHAASRIKTLASGEVAIYTAEGDSIVMKNGHLIEINTQSLQINASTSVQMNTPLLKVTGRRCAG